MKEFWYIVTRVIMMEYHLVYNVRLYDEIY